MPRPEAAGAAGAARSSCDWYQSPENNRAPGNTCLTACHLLERGKRWQEASQTGLQGLRRQHARRAGRPRPRSERRTAGGRRPVAVRADPRPPHRPRRVRPHRARRPAARPGRRADRTRRAAPLLRVREPPEATTSRWLGDLWTRRRGAPARAPSSRRGWDECLAALERLEAALRTVTRRPTRAWPPAPAGSPRRPSPPPCLLPAFVEEPVTALRRAACTSGDSDSIACLTGAFAGAHLGADAWPAEWVGADRVPGRAARARGALGRLTDDRATWAPTCDADLAAVVAEQTRPAALRDGLRRAPVRLPVPRLGRRPARGAPAAGGRAGRAAASRTRPARGCGSGTASRWTSSRTTCASSSG